MRPPPLAARTGDSTDHGGVVGPIGVPLVTIGGQPAAVAGDAHLCPIPQPHPPSVFPTGSATVRIGGRGALRIGDKAGCGAAIVSGGGRVRIGD